MTTTQHRTPRTAVALALALACVGCAKSEPEAPKPVAPAPTASVAVPAAPTQSPRRPAVTLPTVDVKPPPDVKPRHPETPCDRHEAGWKWTGTVVEDGVCTVGPCACVKE